MSLIGGPLAVVVIAATMLGMPRINLGLPFGYFARLNEANSCIGSLENVLVHDVGVNYDIAIEEIFYWLIVDESVPVKVYLPQGLGINAQLVRIDGALSSEAVGPVELDLAAATGNRQLLGDGVSTVPELLSNIRSVAERIVNAERGALAKHAPSGKQCIVVTVLHADEE